MRSIAHAIVLFFVEIIISIPAIAEEGLLILERIDQEIVDLIPNEYRVIHFEREEGKGYKTENYILQNEKYLVRCEYLALPASDGKAASLATFSCQRLVRQPSEAP